MQMHKYQSHVLAYILLLLDKAIFIQLIILCILGMLSLPLFILLLFSYMSGNRNKPYIFSNIRWVLPNNHKNQV